MTRRARLRTLLASLSLALVAAGVVPTPGATADATGGSGSAGGTASTAASDFGPPGTVLAAQDLRRDLWIPRTTRAAYKLRYVTTDAFGRRAASTGTVFVPYGTPPRGGWPVVSWAHGTSGLGDACAPSKIGPTLRWRDWNYLAAWMREGYAIVASDYVGLGTPGLMPYLDGRTTAHNIVDMVKAGRAFAGDRLGPRQQLSRRWVTIGQSQGGGAAIYTARHATRFGGTGLDYRGAVGTGTPAYIEDYLLPLGPQVPPAPLTPGITEYMAYIFAGLRYAHPELGIDSILTAEGKKWIGLAETACSSEFAGMLDGVGIGDWFTAPVATLPGFRETTEDYLGMPESGFDRPFFMGHGGMDTDVPIAQTARYVGVLETNGEPVDFHVYPTSTHNTTLAASLPDSVPFVRRLFR